VGIDPGVAYRDKQYAVGSQSRLFLFSDGAFEIHRPDGTMLEFEVFSELLARPVEEGESDLDRVLNFARDLHGPGALEDDLSIVKLEL
jgi:serine phosphatase RsbU (regulator of sigma subunit)